MLNPERTMTEVRLQVCSTIPSNFDSRRRIRFAASPPPEFVKKVNIKAPGRDGGPSSRSPTYSTYDHSLVLGSGLQRGQLQPPQPPPSPPPPHPLDTDVPAHSNVANYGDSSDKLFSVYLSQADKFDKEQSESWKGDTEGILVFVCPR